MATETAAMPHDREHLALLLRVNAVLHSTRSMEQVMGDMIEEVIASLGAQRGFVVLRRGSDWHALATHYQDPSHDNPDLRFSRTVVEKVTTSDQPLLTVDALEDPRFNVSSVTMQKIRSILCAPLRWGGQVQGVVYADHNVAKGIFTPAQLELLSAIADQASRALEMSALHQQLQQIQQRNAARALSHSVTDWEAQASEETVDLFVDSFQQQKSMPPAPALAPSKAEVCIHLFGPLRVLVEGRLVEHWSTRKNRDLLAYLACQGGQFTHEERLMDLFWSQGGKAGLHSLHNSVTQLRRSLGDRGRKWLQRQFDGYALGPQVWVDCDQFSQSFRLGKRAAHQQLWEEALAHLGQAEALAGGEFLEGNQAEWTFAPRQLLSDQLRECRSLLAEHFSQRGKHLVAVELWKRVLGCDNCCEDAYRGLLAALRALGQRAEATRVYQRCVKAYADELDLEPPEDLRSLLDF